MGMYERISFHRTCRGNGDGMQAKWTIRNTGSPSGDRSVDQLAARERKAGPTGMAEGLVVLTTRCASLLLPSLFVHAHHDEPQS